MRPRDLRGCATSEATMAQSAHSGGVMDILNSITARRARENRGKMNMYIMVTSKKIFMSKHIILHVHIT